jgi:hypothetical protein
MQGSGYLAIWSDIAPEDDTDWAHWMMREHAAERVGIEGFLACRIFRALGTSVNRYFMLYELERPEVVGSPQYLARLNAPTPWSQSIMPRLRNFVRGGGRVVASAGVGQGGMLAVLPLEGAPEWQPAEISKQLADMDRIAAAHVLLTDLAQTSIQTREKSLRSRDGSFAGLLLIEGLDEHAIHNALWRLRSLAPQIDAAIVERLSLYAVVFNLHRRRVAEDAAS